MEREARLPVFIDYKSPCVIQCVGQLATLAQDRVVHSIGMFVMYIQCVGQLATLARIEWFTL